MKRRPRDPVRDKLVNERLISFAYGTVPSAFFALSRLIPRPF